MFLSDLYVRAVVERPGQWQVVFPLRWDDGRHRHVVPVGFTTDLASIPRPFRNILNINGRSRRAAVLHDWLYAGQQCVTRADADQLFLDAMKSDGVSWAKRWSMYAAVRVAGWGYYRRCRSQ